MTPIGQSCTCEPMTWLYFVLVQSAFVFVELTLAVAARRAHKMEGSEPPGDLEHGMTLSDLFSHVVRLVRGVVAKELAKFDVVVPGLAPAPPGASASDGGGDEAPGAFITMMTSALTYAKTAAGTAERAIAKKLLEAAAGAGVILGEDVTEESSLADIIAAARKTLVPLLAEKLQAKVGLYQSNAVDP
jgi:hypothetical protein